MKLSENISFEEITNSSHTELVAENREEAQKYLDNLKCLAVEILQPIRDFYGIPLNVHSGFRGKVLNQAVGGVNTSQHSFGEACDFHIDGVAVEIVFQDIINRRIDLDYEKIGQVIQENNRWIHISIFTERYENLGKECFQALRFDGSNYSAV